jgi:hypothetical protein
VLQALQMWQQLPRVTLQTLRLLIFFLGKKMKMLQLPRESHQTLRLLNFLCVFRGEKKVKLISPALLARARSRARAPLGRQHYEI